MIRGGAIEQAPFGPMSVGENITFNEHEGLVMIIDAPPRFVQAFLTTFGREYPSPSSTISGCWSWVSCLTFGAPS